MSIFAKLFGGMVGGEVKTAGEGVKLALDSVGGLAKDIRIAITGKDPALAAQLEGKLIDLEAQVMNGQQQISLIEAQSSSMFIAGWRPALGWVCVMSLGIYYPFRIISGLGLWTYYCLKTGQLIPMPEIGAADIIGLVLTMLGSSGLRTYEKAQGAQGNH